MGYIPLVFASELVAVGVGLGGGVAVFDGFEANPPVAAIVTPTPEKTTTIATPAATANPIGPFRITQDETCPSRDCTFPNKLFMTHIPLMFSLFRL